MKGRIPEAFQPLVQRALGHCGEIEARSDSDLHAILEAIRSRWRGKMQDLWGRHQQSMARGERSAEDWDPTAGLYTEEDLLTVCALVREVSWRRLHLRHYDVQIAAGLALIQGNFIEMKTGEGKTIVALFPAVVFGLIAQLDWEVLYDSSPHAARRAVHVITANQYLAQRDALEMQPVYEFFGLAVDVLPAGFQRLDKRIAYSGDIVYGTVSEFGFDYLRNHIVKRSGDRQQGRLYFAVIDEVDHILVDEGTTPLLLSEEDPEYAEAQRRTVYLFGDFAQQLYQSPQVFTRTESEGLSLTGLGAKALSVLLEELHAAPGSAAEHGTFGPIVRLSGELCAQVLKLAMGQPLGRREALIEPVPEGKVRLTPAATARLREAVKEWEQSDEAAFPAVLRMFSGVLKARFALVQLAGLSREDVYAMTRLITSFLRKGRRSLADPSAIFERPLELFLGELLLALRQGDPEEFRENLCLLVVSARKAGLTSAQHDWSALIAELETQEPYAFQRFGADLQRYWIGPISRAVSALLAGLPVEDRRGYLAVLRALGAMFTSGHLDPIMNRRLTSLQGYLKDFLFFPTFYTYWEFGEHVQINEPGRALLRDFLREVLALDLWPGHQVEPGEALEEAVPRLYPEAESILRRALYAYIFRRRNIHYIVQDGKVALVNEYTGFLEPQRRYSDLLHLFLERKEGLEVNRRQKTIGRISIQRFVLLYQRLAGMSATAAFAAEEFQKIYGTEVVVIPPNQSTVEVLEVGGKHKPLRDEETVYLSSRADLARAVDKVIAHLAAKVPLTVFAKEPELIKLLLRQVRLEIPRFDYICTQLPNLQRLEDQVYLTDGEKLKAAANIVIARSRRGQAVLVGAPNIEVAEKFAAVLARESPDLDFTPLNARPEHAQREAEIIAKAGQRERVTVATQMAGRGVDILVRPEVVERGGLFVLGLERRESRRWDEQILGRSARQGDLGYGQFLLSLDDYLMQLTGSNRLQGFMTEKLGMEEGEEISHPWVTKAVRRAQVNIEQRKYLTRMITFGTDEELSLIRAELYELRSQALAATHPCRGWQHGPVTVLLELRDPHCVCKACREGQPELENSDSVVLLREGVQWVLAAGLDECLAPVQLENLLVETYASESALVEDWDWESLLRELSDYLGRRVARTEICRPLRLADRMIRASSRKQFVPKAFYQLMERYSDPEAAAYVNPRNLQTPWVERDVLRERLRSLIDEHLALQRIEQLVAEATRETAPGGVFKAAEVYWKLSSLLADEMPERVLGSVRELQERVHDRESLKGFLQERLARFYRANAAVSRESARHQEVVTRMTRLLHPFGVRRQEVESRVAAEEGTSPSFEGLREWAMRRVLGAYRTLFHELGKARLYRLENQALRAAIDWHFHRFLDNYDVYVTSGHHADLEDSIREARLKIRKTWSRLRGAIAQSFADNLAADLERPQGAGKTPGSATRAESLLLDGLDPCTCASGLVFRSCCGSGLYEVLR